MTSEQIISNAITLTEQKIDELLFERSGEYNSLIDAMRYSALAGGKRLRPALLLEFYRICGGGSIEDAVCFAAALEFIHTYSLIHDDLPCMDNDDMRRGKPSCHIKFGEDNALLAGDALLTLAFFAASGIKNIPSNRVLRAINVLADCAGIDGMVGGQVMDLYMENKSVPLKTVKNMYLLKTGALIKAAAEIGCILAGADEEKINASAVFAENIGLAFQIEDDILDITSTAEVLGKPIGSDEKNEKSTYVSLVGMEKSREDIVSLTENAISALSVFPDNLGLCDLARELTGRKK